jgi:indole-3-glycerol phosphate synthase
VPTILDKIVATKRGEIEAAKRRRPERALLKEIESAPPVRNFFLPLSGAAPSATAAADRRIKLIAEIKKASPSKGVIRADFDPLAIARIYAEHGASCLSVLTDEQFFQGRLEYLTQVREAVALPVLRKDFILDRYQVLEARAAGADAVLLIAECLDDCHLRALHNEIVALDMTPLVELYEPANLQRVFDAGATLIGVNNRDLHTFETDLEHTLRLRERVPDECVLVAESGIRSRADVLRLEQARVDAMLVGETLMASPDIAAAVDCLLGRTANADRP